MGTAAEYNAKLCATLRVGACAEHHLAVGEPLIKSMSALRVLARAYARRRVPPMAVALGKRDNAAEARARTRPTEPSTDSADCVALP